MLKNLGDIRVGLWQHDEAAKSYAKAVESFNEALRIAPDDVAAHNNKGLTLQYLGDLQAKLSQQDEAMHNYKLAVTAYSRSLEIAPTQEQIRKLRDSIQQILDKKRIL